MTTFISTMQVSLVKHAASDADVAHAAWVSTLGEDAQDRDDHPDRISGLINFLMRERHGSPFEHPQFTFFIKAPIFVFREFQRHRMFSYSEESGRYKTLEPTFYIPSTRRNLVQQGKPGSYTFTPGSMDQYRSVVEHTMRASTAAYESYEAMLAQGVAREVARSVLPLNIYSSMYASCNARSLMHFLSLRTSDPAARFPSHPLREIEMVGEQMEDIFAAVMPITHAAWDRNGRVAP